MTTASETQWERVAEPDELSSGARKSIFVDDVPVLLLRIGNEYFAIEDVCTHDGQPLTDGPVSNGEITCPRHGARFDLRTGKPMCMPATEPVRTFAVRVQADGIYASPEPAAQNTKSSEPMAMNTVRAAAPPETTASTASPSSVASTEPGEVEDAAIIEALRQVVDPELFVNIIDLGLVYAINHQEGNVQVDMTLTSPACPAGPQIIQQSKQVLERLPGVKAAQIKLVMTPPWTPDRMTDEARDQLGLF